MTVKNGAEGWSSSGKLAESFWENLQRPCFVWPFKSDRVLHRSPQTSNRRLFTPVSCLSFPSSRFIFLLSQPHVLRKNVLSGLGNAHLSANVQWKFFCCTCSSVKLTCRTLFSIKLVDKFYYFYFYFFFGGLPDLQVPWTFRTVSTRFCHLGTAATDAQRSADCSPKYIIPNNAKQQICSIVSPWCFAQSVSCPRVFPGIPRTVKCSSSASGLQVEFPIEATKQLPLQDCAYLEKFSNLLRNLIHNRWNNFFPPIKAK